MDTRPDGSTEDWTNFEVGVEAVIQLRGPVRNVPDTWGPAVASAVAASVDVPVASVEVEFREGFLETTHLWIRVKELDSALEVNGEPQEQQVRANLTAVIGTDVLAQTYLTNAVANAGADATAGRRLADSAHRRLSEDECPVIAAIAAAEAEAAAAAAGSSRMLLAEGGVLAAEGRRLSGAGRLGASSGVGRMLSEDAVASEGSMALEAAAYSRSLSESASALCVELVAVAPTAMCFPAAAGAEAAAGAPSFWMLAALGGLALACYYRGKAKKAAKDKKKDMPDSKPLPSPKDEGKEIGRAHV